MQLSKASRAAAMAIAVCAFVYFVPVFRVRKLELPSVSGAKQNTAPESGAGRATADPAMIVDLFWNEQLPHAIKQAVGVDALLTLAAKDPKEAQRKFGREVGLGGPAFLLVRGRGQIESVNDDECSLVIAGQSQRVILVIGVLFGNAVRDATGLIKVEDFPNSQDFNHLSTVLNSRCESDVIEPVRRQLVVGAKVEFAGCAETREGEGFDPLKLIPVYLQLVSEEKPRE